MRQRLRRALRAATSINPNLLRALTVSAVNQSVFSATNFAYGLYLVRVLTPAEFGRYGIALAASLFLVGVGTALVLTQMVVWYPEQPESERKRYAGRMLAALLIVVGGLWGVGTMAYFLAMNYFHFLQPHLDLSLAVMAASGCFLCREYFIRYAYCRREELLAARINVALAIGLGILLIGHHAHGSAMSAEQALVMFASAHLLAAIYGQILLRVPLRSVRRSALSADIRSHKSGAVLSLFAHIVITTRIQLHTIAVPTLAGPAGLAAVNAARMLIMPVQFLMPAVAQVILPRLAASHVDHAAQAKKLGLTYSRVMIAVVLVYSAVMLTFFESVKNVLIGPGYSDIYGLAVTWCFYAIIAAYKSGLENYIIASRKFKDQLILNLMGLMVGFCAIALFALKYGVMGIMMGLIVSEMIVTAMMRLRVS